MIDYIIMLFILLFLLFEILFRAKPVPVNDHFFDISNSQAMRGFWCLIVVLVHVPAIYQNKIQDIISSFGYIGITFFFMTSAYGLTLSQDKNPAGIKKFWRKRLPKLLITYWLVALIGRLILSVIYKEPFSVIGLLRIRGWVLWLLSCYFIFWITNILFRKEILWKSAAIVLVAAGSLIIYYLVQKQVITQTTWVTECYGFIWGILLATFRNDFLEFFSRKWQFKWICSLVLSLLLGIAYLVFKPVPFWGNYLLKVILGIAITAFILIANARIELGNKINLFLGKISFEIYLSHSIVFKIINIVHEWKYSGTFILVSIIATILMATLIHFLADKLVKLLNKW